MGSFIQLGDNDLTKERNIAEVGDQKIWSLKNANDWNCRSFYCCFVARTLEKDAI